MASLASNLLNYGISLMVAAVTANTTTKTIEENQHNKLTRKERKELHRQERMEEKQKLTRQRTTKRITKIVLGAAIVAGSIGVFARYITTRPPIPEGEIIS